MLSNLGICQSEWEALESRLPCNLPFPWDFGYESDLKFLSVIISFLFHIINLGTRVAGAVSGFIAEFTGFPVKYCLFHL